MWIACPLLARSELCVGSGLLLKEAAHYSYTTQSHRGRRPTIHMRLSPTEGGGPLFTCYSVLLREEAQLFTCYSVILREEAHYSHASQSYRGRRPNIHTLLSHTEGGGPLFTC